MSVSKWAYEPEKCDGDYCVGDCDYCYKAPSAVARTVAKILKNGTPVNIYMVKDHGEKQRKELVAKWKEQERREP